MTRVPFAAREAMDAAGQAVWDEIETSRGGVARNYAALLNNPQAAGALADSGTLARAAALGLDPGDYERRSDSFRFFERLGDALMTGPTGNNVRDVRMLVASGAR